MSESNQGTGCFKQLILYVVIGGVFLFSYIVAVGALAGDTKPSFWTYLGAIPVGLLVFGFYSQNWTILGYLALPVCSVWLLVFFIQKQVSLLALLEGLICFILAIICFSVPINRANSGNNESSTLWGINAIVGVVMGIICVIAGLMAHFIWHV
jgi:hypothetical protein